jgi:phospholipid transport system substrate-binding protein
VNRIYSFIAAAVLVAEILLSNPPAFSAITPATQLQQTWEQIVVILKSASFNSEAAIDSFRIKVMQAINPRFDFAEMAKRCLGARWGKLTTQEREEFVPLFVAMLARSYVESMRSYKDSTVVYARELSDAHNAEVDTRIVTKGADDLLVSYKMHLVDDDWKVYDVIIDHISLISNYRAQFHRVITQSSFDELLRMMKEKNRADVSD